MKIKQVIYREYIHEIGKCFRSQSVFPLLYCECHNIALGVSGFTTQLSTRGHQDGCTRAHPRCQRLSLNCGQVPKYVPNPKEIILQKIINKLDLPGPQGDCNRLMDIYQSLYRVFIMFAAYLKVNCHIWPYVGHCNIDPPWSMIRSSLNEQRCPDDRI